MNLAALSVAALFVTILLSCITKLNVGVLALGMAWIVGVYVGGFTATEIAAGFPVQLFLTLTGMTLLFTQARLNGSLDRITQAAVRGCRGNVGVMPVMFFVLSAALASIGPGNIAAAALVAPLAMTVAARVGVPAFLMALMVANGSNAGSLSPFAPTGIIVNGLLSKIGIPGMEWQSYWTNLLVHAAVALAGYFAFGGFRLFGKRGDAQFDVDSSTGLNRANWVTLLVIASLLLGVIFFKVNVGLGAFAAAALLALVRAADDGESIRQIPWSVIVMVSGVTVLIALLEKTQGLALFTQLLARISTHETVTGIVAFVTGLVSVYSSTSGVVLPAFLPTVPGLSEQLGGVSQHSLVLAMNVGSHLVDISPLSTIGALCLAGAPPGSDGRRLFNQLLAWGLSMTLAGAAIALVFFRP